MNIGNIKQKIVELQNELNTLADKLQEARDGNKATTSRRYKTDDFEYYVECAHACSDVVNILNSIEDEAAHPSRLVENFLKLMRESKNNCDFIYERIRKWDNKTQDILHDIELNDHNDDEYAILGNKLKEIRKERRIDKDAFELQEKIKSCMSMQGMQQAMNNFNTMLGDLRKVEKYHDTRTYHPKGENQLGEKGDSNVCYN